MPVCVRFQLPASFVASIAAVLAVGLLAWNLGDLRHIASVHLATVLVKQFQVFFDLAHPLFELCLAQVGQVPLWHLGSIKSKTFVGNQRIQGRVFVYLDEVVVKLRDNTQCNEVEHEGVSTLCNVRKVPQVDNLHHHDHDHVDEAHKERSQWVVEIVMVYRYVFHHLNRAADLRFKLEME